MKSLVIYIDFKSAASYLAMEATLKLIQSEKIDVVWKPYQVRVQAIADKKEIETVTESHLRVRETQRQHTHLKYAAIQGKPMVFQREPKGSGAALIALAQLDCDPVEYIQAAFLAYWQDGLDLDDPAVVKAILRQCGVESSSISFDQKGNDILATRQIEAEEQGVFDTPMYVVGSDRFLGREQLPWMRALLANKL